MQAFIQSNINDMYVAQNFLPSMQHYKKLLESGTLKHLQPSLIKVVAAPTATRSTMEKKAIMMIQKMSYDYGVTVSNLVDKW